MSGTFKIHRETQFIRVPYISRTVKYIPFGKNAYLLTGDIIFALLIVYVFSSRLPKDIQLHIIFYLLNQNKQFVFQSILSQPENKYSIFE